MSTQWISLCLFSALIFLVWLKRNSPFNRLCNQNETLTCIIPAHANPTHLRGCNERDYACLERPDANFRGSRVLERRITIDCVDGVRRCVWVWCKWCESTTCNEQNLETCHFAGFPLEFNIKYARSKRFDDASLSRKKRGKLYLNFIKCLSVAVSSIRNRQTHTRPTATAAVREKATIEECFVIAEKASVRFGCWCMGGRRNRNAITHSRHTFPPRFAWTAEGWGRTEPQH